MAALTRADVLRQAVAELAAEGHLTVVDNLDSLSDPWIKLTARVKMSSNTTRYVVLTIEVGAGAVAAGDEAQRLKDELRQRLKCCSV